MKFLGVTRIVGKIRFEEVYGNLKAKNCFQRESSKVSLFFVFSLMIKFVKKVN